MKAARIVPCLFYVVDEHASNHFTLSTPIVNINIPSVVCCNKKQIKRRLVIRNKINSAK